MEKKKKKTKFHAVAISNFQSTEIRTRDSPHFNKENPFTSDMSDSTIKPPPSFYEQLDSLSVSPVPSGVLSGALFLKALTKTSSAVSIPNSGTSGSSFAFHKTLAASRPTRLSCTLFGSAMALGTYMMIDGDPLNASGFNFAWLTLYLIVNGKSSILSIFKGRMTPVALSGLALFDAALYGREFFWSKRSPFQQ